MVWNGTFGCSSSTQCPCLICEIIVRRINKQIQTRHTHNIYALLLIWIQMIMLVTLVDLRSWPLLAMATLSTNGLSSYKGARWQAGIKRNQDIHQHGAMSRACWRSRAKLISHSLLFQQQQKHHIHHEPMLLWHSERWAIGLGFGSQVASLN